MNFLLTLILTILIHIIFLKWRSDRWIMRVSLVSLPVLGNLWPSSILVLVLLLLSFPRRWSTIHRESLHHSFHDSQHCLYSSLLRDRGRGLFNLFSFPSLPSLPFLSSPFSPISSPISFLFSPLSFFPSPFSLLSFLLSCRS